MLLKKNLIHRIGLVVGRKAARILCVQCGNLCFRLTTES